MCKLFLFSHNTQMTSLVTLFLACFDSATNELIYRNAGYNPPLLHTQRGGEELLSWLPPTGAAIGLVEEFQFEAESVNLLPGDVLVLHTDGITEAMDFRGEAFGRERLAELARQGSDLAAQDLVWNVRQRLQVFTQGRPLADDTTLIVCKVN
ncbi:MAG: PP2C family protein-serine/threonine phosphatase [Anaerolineae bacterium]|jgi:sigma-B regulation protein RsbU (phosphoserine phosphatase)